MAEIEKARTWELRSFVRRESAKLFGIVGYMVYCGAGEAQPLAMMREPNNKQDSGAVKLLDLQGRPLGYVAREHAGIVSAKMAAGEVLLCRMNGPCMCRTREILIWSEGEVLLKETTVKKTAGTKIKRGQPVMFIGDKVFHLDRRFAALDGLDDDDEYPWDDDDLEMGDGQ